MAMCCSMCHVCLDWDGTRWHCPKCHAYWRTRNRLMQGRKAVGYDHDHDHDMR